MPFGFSYLKKIEVTGNSRIVDTYPTADMTIDRRGFLARAGSFVAGATSLSAVRGLFPESVNTPEILKPERARKGDLAAVISPAGAMLSVHELENALQQVKKMGFDVKPGKNLGRKWGYLGGRDTERVDDLHEAFEDRDVKIIFAIRGGYGTSRLLPALDFNLIENNPKIYMGYSDNTILLNALRQFSHIVTFHGPNASSDWPANVTEHFWQLMRSVDDDARLPVWPAHHVTFDHTPAMTIVPGVARGELVGGNLTLLTNTLGTRWEVETAGKLLFLEDVNESPYQIDRMLTHLWLAGKFQQATGIICGHFNYEKNGGDLSMIDVLKDRLEPLGIPCYTGFRVGHIAQNLPVPVGCHAEMDAEKRELRLLEWPVK